MINNFARLAFAAVLEKLLSIVAIISIARYLSVEEYGVISFALYFGFFLATIAEFAMQTILTRHLVERPDTQQELLGSAIIARFLPVSITLLILFWLTISTVTSLDQRTALLIIGIGQISLTFGYIANPVFRALSRYDIESFTVVLRGLLYVSCILIAIHYRLSILHISLAIMIANILSMIISLTSAFRLVRPIIRHTKRDAVLLLQESAPVALSIILASLFSIISIVVIRFSLDDKSVGLYNSAYALIAHLSFFPEVVMAIAFPMLVRSIQSTDLLQERSSMTNTILVVLSIAVPAMIGVFVVAPEIISLIYGELFTSSVIVLQILAFSLPFSFVNFVFLLSFSAKKIQLWWLFYTFIVITTSFAGYIIIIPAFGVVGAAIIRVLSDITLCAIGTFHIKRSIIANRILFGMARIGFAAVVLGVALAFTQHFTLIVPVAIGATLYMAMILWFGPWPVRTWRAYINRFTS